MTEKIIGYSFDEIQHVDPRLLAVPEAVSYTHLRAHETVLDLVCRLLLEKKKNLIYDQVPTLANNRNTILNSMIHQYKIE